MPTRRPFMSSALGVLALLLGVLATALLAFASTGIGDIGRMILAANGSLTRGIVVVTAVAGLCLVGVIAAKRRGKPRWARLGATLLLLLLLAASACAASWLQGMTRRPLAFRADDGTLLQGTLMLPNRPGRHPAIVVVHGSARLGRDFYAVWTRPLVAAGIAVFVYDKRGTGASEGEIPRDNNTAEYLTQLGNDAARAFDAVQAQADVDAQRIGLLGLSQGGWTVPIAARLRPQVWRIALLSGPAASVGEEMAFSAEAEGRNGTIAEDIAAIAAGDRAAAAAGPSGYAPAADLAALRCPGLWLFGERDRQMPVTASLDVLHRLDAGGERLRRELLPGADHLLLDRRRFPPALHAALKARLIAWFQPTAAEKNRGNPAMPR